MKSVDGRPSYYPLRFVAPLVAPLVLKYGNPKFCRFIMDMLPYKALHNFRDTIDIMDQISREIYAQKKQALADGDEALNTKIGEGKDVLSILSKIQSKLLIILTRAHVRKPFLVRANMSASKHESLSESELLGQMKYVYSSAFVACKLM